MIKQIISAFSMYSAIPMPMIEWSEKNRRYALCFFPLVGAIIGAAEFAVLTAGAYLGAEKLFIAAAAAAVPVLITGGIHLDGYCDMYDALSSCAPKEKALEIMHDPRIGAFAAIRLVIYLLVQTALFYAVCGTAAVPVICTGFVMSRAMSAFAAYTFPSAGNGLLHCFTGDEENKRRVSAAIVLITALITAAACIYLSPVCGTGAVIGAVISFVRYRLTTMKRFGGINGDMAGWFLQICEIYIMAGAYISQLVVER